MIDNMTYPEPRYLGDTGEITATYLPHGAPPDISYANGGTCTYLATGATTGGKFGLYRWDMGAEPSGPAPHFHRSLTESFFILTGTVRIYNGQEWITTVPGDFVHVPEGGVHGFRNESGEPASLLLIFSPGAPREGYFEGIAEWAASGREDQEFFVRHDTFWVDEK